MKRSGSIIRKLNWLDQARYHVRQQAYTASFNTPTCHQCATPVFDAESGTFKYQGRPLVKVEQRDAGADERYIVLVGYCDAPQHTGRREDAIEVKFDWAPSEHEVQRAMASCVFFPRDSQQDNVR